MEASTEEMKRGIMQTLPKGEDEWHSSPHQRRWFIHDWGEG